MRRALLIMAAAAPALAGCGVSRVVGSENSSAYTQMEAVYVFNDRDGRVEVLGDPFGVGKDALAKRTADAAQGRAMGVNVNFTPTPNETARPGYRIAFLFNPVGHGPNGRVCRQPATVVEPPQSGPPYRLYVEAAFCRDGGDYTTARGWLDAATGPDDPHFRQLIGDLTSTLFPRGERDSCGGADC